MSGTGLWVWGCGGGDFERHEGINRTKGATEKFEQRENACGMVKHFCILTAFVKLQIKRQGERARERAECSDVFKFSGGSS